jgi:hypothetical protein
MAYKTRSPIPIIEGGTNAQTMADNHGVVIFDATSLVTLPVGTAGYVLTSNGPGVDPSFQNIQADGAVTVIDADSGVATPSTGVITISGGGTGLTTFASGSTVNLTGTLNVGYGGTGVTSVTTTPTASHFAGWDSNVNFSANSFIPGYTTTATAGTTTTLTVSSTFNQFFTGTLSQTVKMPVVSTLSLGQRFQINNNSSSNITITSSGSNNIQIMAAGSQIEITCISLTGTTASSWDVVYSPGFSLYPGTGALVSSSSGTITDASASTAGFVLTSNGASVAPSFQDAGAVTSVSGNSGSATPSSGVLTISGSGPISTSGSGSTLSLTSTAANVIHSSSGDATASSNAFTIVGSGSLSTSASGSTITISGGGITWVDQISNTVTMAVNHGYVINNGGSLVTLTTPAVAALGDTFQIAGFSAGGWTIAVATNQLIHFGNVTTTTTTGTLASSNAFDQVTLTCVVANTTFVVTTSVGNLSYT